MTWSLDVLWGSKKLSIACVLGPWTCETSFAMDLHIQSTPGRAIDKTKTNPIVKKINMD